MMTSTEEMPGFRSLLRNPEFHLVHVLQEDDGERCSMTVVTPGLHQPTRKQVVEQGYYTISHLWGPEQEWKPWTDHGIIGTDGKPVEVNIRPEKKDGLLRLLSTVPGYWWIDVFCAQSKTPPSIMGDVYRFCNRCYSLVDFPSDGFSRIEAIEMRLKSVKSFEDFIGTYKDRINGRSVPEKHSWHGSLDDILGGCYDGDPTDIKVLADFLSCQWFARVWTLQEYLLPRNLTFISEDDPENYRIDRSIIAYILEAIYSIALMAFIDLLPSKFSFGFLMPQNITDFILPFYYGMSSELYKEIPATPETARCYFDLTRALDIQYYLWYKIGQGDGSNDNTTREFSMAFALQFFARSPRRSMYTRDYIYGVAGILNTNISLEANDEDVWASFRKITQKTFPLLKIPEESPLSRAKNMQDVYEPVAAAIRTLTWSNN